MNYSWQNPLLPKEDGKKIRTIYCEDLLKDFAHKKGLKFKKVNDYQFRISGNEIGFDFYPISERYQNLTGNGKGKKGGTSGYKDLVTFLFDQDIQKEVPEKKFKVVKYYKPYKKYNKKWSPKTIKK